MASQGQVTSNLGLAQLPEIEGADPRLYNEFVRVYNAIRILATNLDRYTGLEFRDDVQQEEYANTDYANTLLIGNSSKIYKTFAVNVSYGQLVNINSAGNVRLANGGSMAGAALSSIRIGTTGALNSATTPDTEYRSLINSQSFICSSSFIPAHGFCSTPGGVLAGEIGEVSLMGIVNASGLTPGKIYQLNGAGIADWQAIINTSTSATLAAFTHNVGLALSATELFINPTQSYYAIRSQDLAGTLLDINYTSIHMAFNRNN